jgi:endo-1,4-beta-xylanase
LNDDGTFRNNIFYRTVGETYIPLSFWAVNQVDPNAKLYYNDYNLEFPGPKRDAALRLVRFIQSSGIRIDGVGLQGHLAAESTESQRQAAPSVDVLVSSLNSFAQLGLEVTYSQVDIRVNTPATQQRLDTQAAAYTRVVQSCLRVSRCVGITFWVCCFPES